MGGRGREGYRTDRMVRTSLRVARRKIRVRNPRGDVERFLREVTGLTVKKNL